MSAYSLVCLTHYLRGCSITFALRKKKYCTDKSLSHISSRWLKTYHLPSLDTASTIHRRSLWQTTWNAISCTFTTSVCKGFLRGKCTDALVIAWSIFSFTFSHSLLGPLNMQCLPSLSTNVAKYLAVVASHRSARFRASMTW